MLLFDFLDLFSKSNSYSRIFQKRKDKLNKTEHTLSVRFDRYINYFIFLKFLIPV